MSSISVKQSEKLGYRPNASTKEKTYIRVIAEVLKKLVNSYQTRSCEDIFLNDDIKFMRFKLKENLKKLMFLEPLEFGQKAEDTIWKSIFYEPIRLFKCHLKTNPSIIMHNSPLYIAYRHHIKESIGYYHKLIVTLMTNYELINEFYYDYFMYFVDYEDDVSTEKTVSKEIKEWAMKCTQRSLLFMGDLYRYEVEIEENKNIKNDIILNLSRDLPCGYYNMALKLCLKSGHAYNQLGTLEMSKNYGLNAAFYFLQAQFSQESFSASKDNLMILYERNIKKLRTVVEKEAIYSQYSNRRNLKKAFMRIFRVKSTIVKYLNIWHCFTNYTIKTGDMYRLCQMCDDILHAFTSVLSYDRKLISKTEIIQRKSKKSHLWKKPTYLNADLLDKLLFVGFASLYTLQCKKMKETTDKEISQELTESDKTQNCDEDNKSDDASNGFPSEKYPSDEYSQEITSELAQCFILNLCGHVLNQVLLRLRDEIKLRKLNSELVFKRHDQASRIFLTSLNDDETNSVENDEDKEIELEQEVESAQNEDVEMTKTKMKIRTKSRLGLNKRLQRRLIVKPCGDEASSSDNEFYESEEDLDYGDMDVYGSDNSEYDDEDDDDEIHESGIMYSEDEDDNDEEDDEEIHSQDEDDHIIRAIVGQDALFGRQVSAEKENNKESNNEPNSKINSLLYHETVAHHPNKKLGHKRDKLKSSTQFDSQDTSRIVLTDHAVKLSHNRSAYSEFPNTPSTDDEAIQLAKSLDSVDILQTVTGVLYYLFRYLLQIPYDNGECNKTENMSDDTQSKSFSTSNPAPYLWKHMIVLMNFVENSLDDLDSYNEPINASPSLKICSHITFGNIRQTPKLPPDQTLPENEIFQGTVWYTDQDIESNQVSCSNWLHIHICRLMKILEIGDWLLNSKVSRNLPIKKKSVFLQSNYQDIYVGNSARKQNIWILDTAVKSLSKNKYNPVYSFFKTMVNECDYDQYLMNDEDYDTNTDEDEYEEVEKNQQTTNNNKSESPDSLKSNGVSKEVLIHKLAQLRLKSELDKRNSPKPDQEVEKQNEVPMYENQSVYIIPDLDYLCKNLDQIRAIISTQKHILVIPAGLLARMDQLKKQYISFDVRNTAKFLEEQFKNKQGFVRLDNLSQPGSLNNDMSDQIGELISDWPIIEGSAQKVLENKFDRSEESLVNDTDLFTTTILTEVADKITEEVKQFYSSGRIFFKSHIEI